MIGFLGGFGSFCIKRNPTTPSNPPVIIAQSGRVPESLGEGVGVDLELGDELVLVGRHRREDGLREDVGSVELLLDVEDGSRGALGAYD